MAIHLKQYIRVYGDDSMWICHIYNIPESHLNMCKSVETDENFAVHIERLVRLHVADDHIEKYTVFKHWARVMTTNATYIQILWHSRTKAKKNQRQIYQR